MLVPLMYCSYAGKQQANVLYTLLDIGYLGDLHNYGFGLLDASYRNVRFCPDFPMLKSKFTHDGFQIQ